MPAAARPAVEALWRLDVTLGSVLATGREPMVTRIRLAWWREALERLDREPPPPEPVLQGVAAHVIPAGVSGAELAAMEAGWAALASGGGLNAEALRGFAETRGGLLFRHTARLLGEPASVERAGARWALVDLARRTANRDEARMTLDAAARVEVDTSWPSRLRPLGMLATLAERDVARGSATWERQGSPARMFRMFRHRFTGR